MSIYLRPDDFRSHRVILFSLLKDLTPDFAELTDEIVEQFLPLNPHRFEPIFEEKEFLIAGHLLVMEFLEERFPYKPLYPHIPKEKAGVKFLINNLQKFFDRYLDIIESSPTKKIVEEARKALQYYLLYHEQLFEGSYIQSATISVLDCFMIPTIYRANELKIDISKSKLITKYLDFHSKQPYFQNSLTILNNKS